MTQGRARLHLRDRGAGRRGHGDIIPVLATLIQPFVGSNTRAGVINGVFIAVRAEAAVTI